MNDIKEKFELFVEITRLLNKYLNISPILYGSLGLNRLVGQITPIDDIDILVPDEFMQQRYSDLRSLIENSGFVLTNEGDEHSQDFQRGASKKVAFAKESVLFDIPNFAMDQLTEIEEEGCRFRSLTPKHYLGLYEFLQTCDYRLKDPNKSRVDKIRIRALKKFLNKA